MNKARTIIKFVITMLVLGIVAYLLRDDFRNPFQNTIELASPSFATTDAYGNLYVVDKSLTRVLRLNSNYEATLTITGGSKQSNSFFNAENVAADEAGYIYVSDTVISDNQTTVAAERLLRYNSFGIFDSEVFYYEYPDETTAPLLRGGLSGISASEGKVSFVMTGLDGITAYQWSAAEGCTELFSIQFKDARIWFEDARLLPDKSALLLTRKDGCIVRMDKSGEMDVLYTGHDRDENGCWSVPNEAAVDADGNIYFTDIGSREVIALSADSGTAVGQTHTVLQRRGLSDGASFGESPIYTRLNVQNGVISTVDTFSVIVARSDGTTLFDGQSVRIGLVMYAMTWVLLASLAGILACIIASIVYIARNWPKMKSPNNVYYIGIALVLVVSSSFVVGGMMISNMTKQLSHETLQSLAVITQMTTDFENGDEIKNLNSISDFRSEPYMKIKNKLDNVIRKAYEWDTNPYYIIYKTDGETVYRVMDYVNQVGVIAPMDTAYPGSYYEYVMTTGEQEVCDSFADSSGIWTFIVGPIYDSAGNVVAAIEIGRNLYALNVQRQEMVADVVRNVIVMLIVMAIVFTELIFVVTMFSRQRRLSQRPKELRRSGVEVVRPLAFLLLIADYMQNGFEPIFLREIYTPLFSLSVDVGLGIPLSSEVAATALSAILAGALRRRMGLKPMLYFGVICSGAGIVLRGLSANIPMFIVGKLITGLGMGFVFVALNTFISEQDSPEHVSLGFTGYFAGMMSAINVGVVLGSAIADSTDYRTVYLLSGTMQTIIGVATLLLVRGSMEPKVVPHKENERSSVSILRFLTDRRVLGFQLLMFMPYLILSYFLYYFYPLFAADNGMSDMVIGQTFLINGLCVIYIGPLVTPYILKRLGERVAAVVGGGAYVGALVMFALQPSVTSAVIAIAIMGVADSFTFSAMSAFYGQLDIVRAYGESHATGIKSTAENIAYSAAPFIYGAALMCGTSHGMLILAIAFSVMLALFLLLTISRRRAPTANSGAVSDTAEVN